MKSYLISFDGKKCPVDVENPLVIIKNQGIYDLNYGRGSIVYPISDSEDKKPGHHSSHGWITVSTLNTSTANFLGFEVGRSILPLKELVDMVDEANISMKVENSKINFYLKDKKIKSEEAIETILNEYSLFNLPKEIRTIKNLSEIINSEKSQYERGIIFDSLEDLAFALKMYENGIIKESSATMDRLHSDMFLSKSGGMGVDDPLLMRQNPESSLISLASSLIKQKKASLADQVIVEISKSIDKRNYSKHFDYDGLGTSFFKTTIEVEKIDNKYVLGISAAYVGDEPEQELAKTLGKGRGLVNVSSIYNLKPVYRNFVGVDLKEILKGNDFDIKKIAKIASSEQDGDKSYQIEIEGLLLNFALSLREENNYRPKILRVRDTQLFLETQNNGKPYLSMFLKTKKEKEVLKESKEKLVKVRDNLHELILKNIFLK